MSQYTSFSYEWVNWIIESLANGYSPRSLVETMVEKGYDELAADQLVARIAIMFKTNLELREESQNNYIYEPPRFPMKENIIHTSDRDVQVIARVEKPVVVVLYNLLSPEECDTMISLAKEKQITRSVVIDPKTGMTFVDAARTSSGTFFRFNENELITRLDRRIAEVMNCPIQNGEEIQILNYDIGKGI